MNSSDPLPGPSVQRLLVVDDNPEVLEMVAFILRQIGWGVDTAGDGRSALALASERRWAATILDIDLPDVDGIELLLLLRSRPGGAGLPAVFITGRADLQRSRLIASLGRAILLPKPFDWMDITDAVGELLGNTPSTASDN